MEFVNKTRQYNENTNNMYYQNNTTDDTCYFENRLTSLSYQELLEYKKTIHYENNNKYGINN